MTDLIDKVSLIRDDGWESLPPDVQAALVLGVGRVRAIRDDIQLSARVRELPAVEVLDVALVDQANEGCVFALNTVVLVGSNSELGARIAAPTAIHASDAALRGILLHEFCHCFFKARRLVDAIDKGIPPVFDNPEDAHRLTEAEWDRARLDPPALWYSEGDVSIFPYHDSPLLTECMQATRDHWMQKGLPARVPPIGASSQRLMIPDPIVDRIRETRVTCRPNP